MELSTVTRPTSPQLFRLLNHGTMLIRMMVTLILTLFWPRLVSKYGNQVERNSPAKKVEEKSDSDTDQSDDEIQTPTVSLFPPISNFQKLNDDTTSPKPCATDTYFGMLPMVNPQGEVVGWDVCDNTMALPSHIPFDLDLMYSMDSLSEFSSVNDTFFMGAVNMPMNQRRLGPERKRSTVAHYTPYERQGKQHPQHNHNHNQQQQQHPQQQHQQQQLAQDFVLDLGSFPSDELAISPLSHSSYAESTLSSPKFQMTVGLQQQMSQQILPQNKTSQLFFSESPSSDGLDFESLDAMDHRFSSCSSIDSAQALDYPYLIQEPHPTQISTLQPSHQLLEQSSLEQQPLEHPALVQTPIAQPALEHQPQPLDFFQMTPQSQHQAPVVTLSPPASSRSSSPYSVSNSGSAGEEGDNVPKFVCPHCDATFRIRGYLTRHLKKHSEKKAHTCPFYDCTADMPCHPSGGFSRRDTYKTHLKARHFIYPPGTKSAQRSTTSGTCSGCGETFESNEAWIEEHIHKGECKGLPDFDGVPGRVCATEKAN